MKRSLQEAAFVSEIERRIDQLAFELDLDYRFVVGALELIVHGIKNAFFDSTDEEEEEEEEEEEDDDGLDSLDSM